MRVRVEINEVIPDSYKKGDVTYNTLQLCGIDKSVGQRLKHAVTLIPDRTQREVILTADLRDKVVEFDVTEIVPANYGGGVHCRGFVVDLEKFTAGPLKVDKPAKPEVPAAK